MLQECVDKTWSCHERGDGGADPGGDLAQDNGHGARRQDVRVSIVTIMVIIWSEVATWCHGMGTMIHNPWDTPSLKAIMHCLVLLVVKLLLYLIYQLDNDSDFCLPVNINIHGNNTTIFMDIFLMKNGPKSKNRHFIRYRSETIYDLFWDLFVGDLSGQMRSSV